MFGYDDSLDAFGVHGAGGTLGALLTGVFATKEINDILSARRSAGSTATPAQIANQAIGVRSSPRAWRSSERSSS